MPIRSDVVPLFPSAQRPFWPLGTVRLARALSPKAFILACFGHTCSDYRLGYFRRIFASCRSRPSFLPLILSYFF